MDNTEIAFIRTELETALVGQRFGRVFPLSRLSMAIDFRPDGSDLFVSIEPTDPRAYLIKRRLRDLEKETVNPISFVLGLRKRFAGGELTNISKPGGERVLIFTFIVESETGADEEYSLAVQLTGRSANMFVLDHRGMILDRLRETEGEGQDMATIYAPPVRSGRPPTNRLEQAAVDLSDGLTLSEKLDEYYLAKEAQERFQKRAETARKKLRGEIVKKRRLDERLRNDLKEHGNVEQWKRSGDLLLANAANARRDGDRIYVIDFYDEATPEIEIEGEANLTLSDVAARYFRRYTKARNAASEIAGRIAQNETEIVRLEKEQDRLEKAISEHDESYFAPDKQETRSGRSKQRNKNSEFNGARRFLSSDGYEILVGKKAKDNDHLTFRIARSLDVWLHAADYPGSHVVIRNPNRNDVPHGTLLEAAQLAAFYSDARKQPKAAVNYTQKKFVNKPRGAAPGLVRLASFKTVLVVPQVPEIKNAAR